VRYVDPALIEKCVSADWLVKAKRIRAEVEAVIPNYERAREIINQNSVLWRELKSAISQILHGKCWYCEVRQDRSDDAIDHFRPKGRVAEDKHHPGYWWLAFEPSNYRYSCTYCNSHRIDVISGKGGGKQDHFPLSPTGVRAERPTDVLSVEKPALLDPCRQGDPNFIFIDETGLPSVNPVTSDLPYASGRVEVSMHLYHWRQTALSATRRIIFKEVEKKCRQADHLFDRYQESEDIETLDRWIQAVQEIADMYSPYSEHSATAKCALLGLRTASISADRALDAL
jgi:hypothetical protein